MARPIHSSKKFRARKQLRQSTVEALEARIAPAYVSSLAGSVATVSGNSAANGGEAVNITQAAGFLLLNGSFDWDTSTLGIQFLAAASTSTINLSTGLGADMVNLGDTGASPASTFAGTVIHVTGHGPTQQLSVFNDGDATGLTIALDGTSVNSTGAFAITYSAVGAVKVTGGTLADTFTLNGSAANVTYTLDGKGGSDTIAATANANFGLTDLALNITGAPAVFATPFNLTAIEVANLTATGATAHNFTVGGWSGSGTLTGSATATDTVTASQDTSFNLSNTSLQRTGFGTFTLSSIDSAALTGGIGANTFTVANWTGTANLDGAAGADIFSVTFNGTGGTVNVTGGTSGADDDHLDVFGTAGDDGIQVSATAIGRSASSETINYNTLESMNVRGGMGDDTFTLVSSLAGVSYTLTGGPHTTADSVSVTASGDFDLTANTLTLTAVQFASPFTLNTIETANLTGDAGNNNFNIHGFTGTANVDTGGGTGEHIDVTFNGTAGTVNVLGAPTSPTITVTGTSGADTIGVSATAVTRGTETVNYGTTGTLNIDALAGDDTFDLTGSAAQVTYNLIGGAHTTGDTVRVTADADFTLSDASLQVVGGGFGNPFALTGIETVKLTGGVGANHFTIANYSKQVFVDGAGGSDQLTFTLAAALPLVVDSATHGTIVTPTASVDISNVEDLVLHGTSLSVTGSSVTPGFHDDDMTYFPGPAGTNPSRFQISDNGAGLTRMVTFDGPLDSVTEAKSLSIQAAGGADDVTLSQDGSGFGHYDNTLGGVTYNTAFKNVDMLFVYLGVNDAIPFADKVTIKPLNNISGLKYLNISTDSGDDTITIDSTVTTLDLGVPGGTFNINTGSGSDSIKVSSNTNLTLSNDATTFSLEFGDGSALTYAGLENFDLTVTTLTLSGNSAETVTWTPSGVENWSGLLHVVNAGFVDRDITYHSAGPLFLEQLFTLNLRTPAGADTYTLEQLFPGALALSGSSGTAAQHAASLSQIDTVTLDFGVNDVTAQADKLTVKSLSLPGLNNLSVLTGAGADTLELTTDLTTTKLGTGTPLGFFSFDGGADADTIVANITADVLNLKNTTLGIGNTTPLTHLNVETFDLTASEVSYTGSGTEALDWQPSALTANSGTVGFTVSTVAKTLIYHGPLGLSTAASIKLTTPAGADTFTLAGSASLGSIDGSVGGGATTHSATFDQVPSITFDFAANDAAGIVADQLTVASLAAPGLATITLKTGAGDDKLVLQSTVTTLLSGAFNFDAGAGNDTIDATADVSMVLADGSLAYQDNSATHTARGSVTFTASAVENALLTGGASANRFLINGWSHNATVLGLAGDDLFDLTGGFTGTGSFQGGNDNDTFFLQNSVDIATHGAGAGAAFDGGAGTDTLKVTANINLQLTDVSFLRMVPKTGRTIPASSVSNVIASIEAAVLQGGSRPNLLDAHTFSGTADLAGEGSVDNILAAKGGGNLYGFHLGGTAPTVPEIRNAAILTRDNFFVSDGTAAASNIIYASPRLGNAISFRYYHSSGPAGVNFTAPDALSTTPQTVSVGGAPTLGVALAAGRLSIIEGTRYNDVLTGNRLPNVLSGLTGDDTLNARGVDLLFGGLGKDTFTGFTPFRFQEATYVIPTTTGAYAVPAPARFPAPARVEVDPIASIIASAQ